MSLIAICLSLTPAPQEPEAQHRSFELFSLRPFVTRLVEPPRPPYGTLLPAPDVEDWNMMIRPLGDEYDDDARQFDSDDAVSLVEMLHRDAMENDRLWVSAQGDRLMVQTDAPTLATLRTNMHDLFAALGRPIEVKATLFRAPADFEPAAIMTPEAYSAFAQTAERVWTSQRTTRSSVRIGFDALRWVRYVRDVDVEVAQKSKIASPIVDSFAEGLRLSVDVHSMCGAEDIVLCVQFAIGERRNVETVVTGIDNYPSIDLPRLDAAFGCVGGRLASGGALAVPLLGLTEAGSRFVLTLSPRYPTPRPTERVGAVTVLPISALTHTAMLSYPLLRDSRPLTQDRAVETEFHEYEGEESLGFISADALADLLYSAAGEESDLEVTMRGGFAFVRGADSGQRATAVIAALQDRMIRNVTVRCTVLGEQVQSTSPFASPVPAGDTAALHDVAMPCLHGRTATMFRGIESNVIRSLLPEIAQESSIWDTFIENRRSGLWLQANPTCVDGGVDCKLGLVFEHQSPLERRPQSPAGLVLLNDTSSIHVATEQRFDAAPTALGQGASVRIGDRTWRPAVMVSCR